MYFFNHLLFHCVVVKIYSGKFSQGDKSTSLFKCLRPGFESPTWNIVLMLIFQIFLDQINTQKCMVFTFPKGYIAVGKTMLIEKLGNKLKNHRINVLTAAEPLEQWTGWQVKGKPVNLLNLQYLNPSKYAMSFQMAAAISKTEQLINIPDTTCLITERSLDSQKNIFVPALQQSKQLTDLDVSILEQFFNLLGSNKKAQPDFYIYLKTYPEMVQSRAALCGRPEEKGVDLDLLRTLHKLHKSWLLHNTLKDKMIVVCPDEYPDLDDISQSILEILKSKNII